MEELKLPMNSEEEEKARETMEQMQESVNATLTGTAEIPKEELNDQWKRGGLCALCRRKDYCKTRCRANRVYASARLGEYLRRRGYVNEAENG